MDEILLQFLVVVYEIPSSLELLQMRVVVARHAAEVHWIRVVFPSHRPARLVHRITRRHVHHGAGGWRRALRIPSVVTRPVDVVRVHARVADEIELVRLEVELRRQHGRLARDGNEVSAEPHDPRIAAAAEGEVASAVRGNRRARVERHLASAREPRRLIHKRTRQRACPWTDRTCCSQHARTRARIREVHVEMRLSVSLDARDDRRRPACDGPGRDRRNVNLAMVRPVDHVGRRHHRDRLDLFVRVTRPCGRLLELLVVVRGVDVETSVVLDRRRIRSEAMVEDRVPVELAVNVFRRSRSLRGAGDATFAVDEDAHHVRPFREVDVKP